MLGVRRASLVRQMAFRQDSNEAELSVRHGHLAAPLTIPDSPRPQKDGSVEGPSPSPLSVVMPVPPNNPQKESTPPVMNISKENRVKVDEWPKLQPSAPFHKLPILEEDRKVLAQSNSIVRYLAKKFGNIL